MSAILKDTAQSMAIALTSSPKANEVVNALNKADALWTQSAKALAAVIVATSTSTTVDFGALKVGDQVIHIPASAGNAKFSAIVTLGTLPEAAVIGDLYVVLRAMAAPTASNIIL